MKTPVKANFKKAKVNKKHHVLLFFLSFSFLFWVLTNLSKEYTTVMSYKILYVNLPVSKLFQNSPEADFDLRIKGTGFKLFSENLFRKSLYLDMQKVNFKQGFDYYLLPNAQKSKLQEQLRKGLFLEQIIKDTLFFELGQNKQKKVPVKENLNLRFKSGYSSSESFKIQPDSIRITGPEIQINQIDFLIMDNLDLKEVFEDVSYEVALQLPQNLNKIAYSHKSVKVEGKVEKFTEGSFEIPFEIDGLPQDANVTTYPKTVQVIFQVGLSNYNKIAAEDFEVRCNYAVSKENKYNYLSPKLVKKPSWVKTVKLIPDHIEYLIQQ
jgi:hypothetical protein